MKKTHRAVEIAEGIYAISEYNLVNAFLVVGDEKAALIDTCCGLGNIRETVETLTDKPLVILLTHGHSDHTGGVYHFADDCGIYMSVLDNNLKRMTNEGRRWYAETRGPIRCPGLEDEMVASIPLEEPSTDFTFVDIKEGDVFELGGVELEVLHTPGHTEGSVCFLDKKHRILFSGDSLNKSIILPRQMNNSKVLIKRLHETMDKIWNMSVYFEIIAVGHDGFISSKDRVMEYIKLTEGLLEDSITGNYEEEGFRAGDVVRSGDVELWYQCDR